MVKCKYCGKEIKRPDRLNYCSLDCYRKANNARYRISTKIDKIARDFDFEIKNKDKIIKAKQMIFKNADLSCCPCDANNPDRFCGSARCIADVVYKGHCHCNLFHYKKKPLLDNNE